MICDQVRDRMPDYWAGNVSDTDRREVDAHVASCPSCRLDAKGLDEIWAALGSVGDEAPSFLLRGRFAQTLAAYQIGLEERESQPRDVVSWQGWSRLLFGRFAQAAAVVVLVAGGFVGGYAQRPAPSTDAVGALREEVHDLRRMFVLSLLEQQSATERLRAFSWTTAATGDVNEEVVTALLKALRDDPNVNVRLRAAEALGALTARVSVREGLVAAAYDEESPLVQIALMDVFLELPQQDATAAFRRLLQKDSLYDVVRQRAEQGLRQVSGG